MAQQKLARGLDAIFGQDVSSVLDDIMNDETKVKNEIKISDIHLNPYQPRITFDQEKLKELAQSIKEHGVFTPILVRKGLSGYELIAGERRLRASKIAELETIPAIILDIDDDTMMQVTLLENIQRENLNPMEEANGYYQLIKSLNLTQEQLAAKLGKSRAYIANMLRIREVPEEIKELVAQQKLSGSHVRTLLQLSDSSEIVAWAKRIVQEDISVHQLEQLLKDKNKTTSKKEKIKDIYLTEVEKNLRAKFQTEVEVDKHKIIISYSDNEDLNRILEIINGLEEEL